MKQGTKKIRTWMGKIAIVDRFLLLFMLILFGYLAIHLMIDGSTSDTNTIDVLVRTSAAAIFGYFISGNFLRSSTTSPGTGETNTNAVQPPEVPAFPSENQVKGQIGFQASTDSSQVELGKASSTVEPAPETGNTYGKIQITVVAVIGLVSFGILLVARIFPEVNAELTATISQLRDFIFASIGFLISCAKGTTN